MSSIFSSILFISFVIIVDPLRAEAKVLIVLMDDEPVFSFKSKQAHSRCRPFLYIYIYKHILLCLFFVSFYLFFLDTDLCLFFVSFYLFFLDTDLFHLSAISVFYTLENQI